MVEQIRQGDIPGVQLRYRHWVQADPTETWTWLTRAENQIRWLADEVEPDGESVAMIQLQTVGAAGGTSSERLVTLVAEPPRRWVFDLQDLDGNWPVPTRVEIDLEAADRGTEISILQKGFAHLPLSDCLTIWEAYRRRWRTALTSLAQLIAEQT